MKIDAPEMNQGGEKARDWLTERIFGKNVQIIIDLRNRVDKFGRLLGHVFHGGSQIGDEMLNLGLATLFEFRGEVLLPDVDEMFAVQQWL